MIGGMKFEETSLTGYLVKNLEPLTEADSVILAEYVVTLLKKDKPTKELQKLCTENLVEFLGHDTKPFIAKLFQDLEDGSIISSAESLDTTKQIDPSLALTTINPVEHKSFSPKPEKLSASSGHVSDPEEKEVTDDDDDDRNHKHRRRETQSLSSDKDAQEQVWRRPNRKRDGPFENGQPFLRNDPLESAKFEKRRPGLAALPRAMLDVGQRTRVPQTFYNDTGPRFDFSTSLGRFPIGRGRGRSTGPWNQQDSRFSSVDTLDFAPQMASQGPTPPSLFTGMGLPNAASTQSAPWGAFGLIHGMPNGGLDTLHPLGLHGTLHPPINPSLSIGLPRQRCRDFEERGFCLRGDMCPMEHGVNRIVVEDVQSLSQFNLPVSISSARLLGMQDGAGPLPPVPASSGLLTNSKGLHSKTAKPGVTDVGLGLNGLSSGSVVVGEADLYDPDQPLWNNDRAETSGARPRLPLPKIDDSESLWDADSSDRHSFRIADGIDDELPGKNTVWGRIGNSGNRLEMKVPSSDTGYLGNESKKYQEPLTSGHGTASQAKQNIIEDASLKDTSFTSTPKFRADSASNVGRVQKALRTLFVNGIPLKNNKREALLSHFQKFGEIIDIYIPQNSEKAFVQFSKREEAEAALKAPDAVMGNRFIKLWWANRDSIPAESEGSGNTVYAASRGVMAASVPSKESLDRGKENLPSIMPKLSTTSVSNVTIPVTVPPKTVVANSPKAIPPLQKKLESLELLKEELRIKQEMLDQKRNDFRRQLDKLEKHAITVKGEISSEQAVKRLKVEMATDVAKAASARPTTLTTAGLRPEAEKMLDQSSSGEKIASPSPKAMPQQSPRSLKQPTRLPPTIVSPFSVNRFKLDNRPTAFRILPPWPADFVNVAVLKEHFSSFGDLSTVELEDADFCAGSVGLKASQNCSAHITFKTRRSAERAFLNGKCWQGHNLQFSWLSTSSNSTTDHGGRENSPSLTPKGPPDAEILAETVTVDMSSPHTRESTCGAISQAIESTEKREPDNVGANGGFECLAKELVDACHSSSPTMSPCENQTPKADVMNIEDGLNVGVQQ
ncbi:zinc finger CCCH domain-containing protein 27-like [Tasmannia lanceolata]|uniref:zinc finger CCCH domain-containing protein 27-like n=1 Tax=Tasmannia lanceolata TaxID=3420 RepID=UPI004063D386